MRILIATDTYYPHVNGASYFAQRLAFHLTQRGHDLLVIAPATRFSSEFRKVHGVDVFGVRSLPVLVYKDFRAVLPVTAGRHIRECVRTFKPDIVHVLDHFPISRVVINEAHRRHIPIVGTNNFMPENLTHHLHLPIFLENIVKALAWKRFKQFFEPLSVVTTPTESAAQLMKRYGFSKTVYPVSCGIDLTRFNPTHRDRKTKERFHLLELPLLLYVGRLDKEKNLDFVLKAIAHVPRTVRFHFAIAGKGAETDRLRGLAKSLGIEDRVTFTGFIQDNDLPALYAAADCFVIAGTAELQSIVTMEAMASGLPVLAVNAVALPELVHDGENGFLFHIDTPNVLTERMITVFADEELRRRMGKKSLELIVDHDIERTLSTFEELYQQVIHNDHFS